MKDIKVGDKVLNLMLQDLPYWKDKVGIVLEVDKNFPFCQVQWDENHIYITATSQLIKVIS